MKEGVVVTSSCLQYKVLSKGTGAIPKPTDKVSVHYEGRLVDGTVFDSSYQRKRPATFAVNQVIQGWIQALTMMPVGSKWEIYVPQELAYAERDQGKIPPFSCLIFTVELLEIVQ
jgi:FKBP-type peptidyl-prolyl cis-trans isomerase FklB